MKKLALLFLATFAMFATPALTQEVTLSYNLRSDATMKWLQHNDPKKKCYPLGKGDSTDDFGSETVSVPSDKNGQNQTNWEYLVKSRRFGRSLGSIKLNVSQLDSADGSRNYRFKLIDQVAQNGSSRNDNRCNRRSLIWNMSEHRITGEIWVNYTFPKDTWLTKVKISNASGAALKFSESFQGVLIEKSVETNNEIYLWGKPGLVVSIPIHVNLSSPGGEIGALDLTIAQDSSSQPPSNELMDLSKTYLAEGVTDDFRNRFLSFASLVFNQPQVADQISKSLPLEKFTEYSDWLFQLANSDIPGNKYEIDIKAAAAAVGYKMALALLDELKGFCTNVDVKLAMQNKTVTVPGIYAAYFWLNRDLMRVRSLASLPEVRSLVEEFVRWENNGKSFAEVAKNTSHFEKIRNSYILIRQVSQLANDVFGDFALGLEQTYSVFNSVGSGALKVDEIQTQIAALRVLQEQFNKEFKAVALSFNAKNNSPVQASHLIQQLNAFEGQVRVLEQQFLSSIKLVAPQVTDGETGVLNTIISQLAHQVNVFDQPLKSPQIEPIRGVMAEQARSEKFKEIYGQCLGGFQL